MELDYLVSHQINFDVTLDTLVPCCQPMDIQRRAAYPILEAAFLLGISRSGLYDLLAEGALHRIKIGRRSLIPASEIERLVSLHTTTKGTDNDPPAD